MQAMELLFNLSMIASLIVLDLNYYERIKMKVNCIANTGKSLLPETLNSKCHYLQKTLFLELKIGGSYNCYGISLWSTILHCLIIPENTIVPSWYPIDLFTISDPSIPDNWFFNVLSKKNGRTHFTALWGYQELVTNLDHWPSLFEQEKEAIEIFTKRKMEIDEFCRNK